MQVIRIPCGIYQTNCYLAFDQNSKEGFLVDPAGEEDLLKEQVEKHGVDVRGILLTHGHGDHIGAVNSLRAFYGVPVYAHEDEEKLLSDPNLNLSSGMFRGPISIQADHWLKDGETIPILEGIKVIHTPGHSEGCVCYRVGNELFSGDTLFLRSIGRTDLVTSDEKKMQKSLKKFKTMDDTLRVHPGHGPQTFLKEELKYNPFLR